MTAPLRRHWSPIAKSRSKKWMSQLSQPILHQIEKKRSKDGQLTGVETHWSVYKHFENFQQELGQRMVIEKTPTEKTLHRFLTLQGREKIGPCRRDWAPNVLLSGHSCPNRTNKCRLHSQSFWFSWVFLDDCIFLLSNSCCYWNMSRLALITLIA